MKLNHINLCTSDVTSLSNTFAHHFGFDVLEANNDYATLRGSDGFFLVLTKINHESPQTYPYSLNFSFQINFHVGFMIDYPEEVHAKHEELSKAGYQLGPIKNFEASGAVWTAFYCSVGDGIDIEVNAHVPMERK